MHGSSTGREDCGVSGSNKKSFKCGPATPGIAKAGHRLTPIPEIIPRMPGHLLILKCNLNPNISLRAANLARCPEVSADRPLYRETHIPVTISNSGARILASPPVVTCLHLLEIIHHPSVLQAIIPHQCPQEITRRRRALQEIICNPPVFRLTILHHPVHREHMVNPHTTPHLVYQADMDMLLAHLNETLATLKVGLPCLRRSISSTALRCKVQTTKYNNHSSNIRSARERRERFALVSTTSISPHSWLAVSMMRTT